MIDQIESVTIVVFAVVFVIVGLLRVVEFKDVGLPPKKRCWLVALHIAGTLLLGTAFFVSSLKVNHLHQGIMFGCFVGALVFIAPGQFTLGMIHRKANEERLLAEGKPIVARQPLISRIFKSFKRK
jgi:uncharacterized membrane protein